MQPLLCTPSRLLMALVVVVVFLPLSLVASPSATPTPPPGPAPTPGYVKPEEHGGLGFTEFFAAFFVTPLLSGDVADAFDVDWVGTTDVPKGKNNSVAQATVVSVQVGAKNAAPKSEKLPGLGGESQIEAANSSGVAVGTCQDKSNNFVACIWEPEGTNPVSPETKWMVAPLEKLSDSTFSEAFGINDDGVAVGESQLPNSLPQAVLWDTNGTIARLNDIASNSTMQFMQANAINSSGQIVGQALNSNNSFTAFLLDPDGTATDLGALLGSPYSHANAINDSGEIVGQASLGGKNHAFLIEGDGTTTMDLGTLPGDSSSTAEAINPSGLIIGESSSSTGTQHAVLWDTNGIHDLNTLVPDPKLVYTAATAVDTNGDIFVQAENTAKAQFGLMLLFAYPPTITAQPSNLEIPLGAKATFSVIVTGTPPLKFQWYFNGTHKIAGATSSTYSITKITAKNLGNYSVSVSNSQGSTNSISATLTPK